MSRTTLPVAGRTRGLAGALVLAALASPAGAQSAPLSDLRTRTSGSDWPAFLGPTADSKSTETGILTAWPPAGPPLLWHREAGEGYATPATSRGRLFFFDRHGERVRLTAVASETGAELWRSEYPTDYVDDYGYSGGPRAAPVVDGDLVYTHGAAGRLRSHRVRDGALVWEVDTFAEFGVRKNFFGVGSAPVVEGELLLLAVGGSPASSPDVYSGRVVPNGTAIVAFNKRTGAVRYTVGQELASYSTPRVATIGDRRWAFYFARGGLLAFDPTTGRLDFHFPWRARNLYSVNASSPVVVGDTVFLTESYGPGGVLLRIGGEGYEVEWKDGARQQSLANHWNTPVYHRGYLYGSSGEKSGPAELRCVDHRTGEVKWGQRGLRRSSLLYVDGHLVVLGEYGQLLLVEATPELFSPVASTVLEGEVGGRRRELVRYPAWGAPVLSHGLLYLRGKDRLVCLELIPAG